MRTQTGINCVAKKHRNGQRTYPPRSWGKGARSLGCTLKIHIAQKTDLALDTPQCGPRVNNYGTRLQHGPFDNPSASNARDHYVSAFCERCETSRRCGG